MAKSSFIIIIYKSKCVCTQTDIVQMNNIVILVASSDLRSASFVGEVVGWFVGAWQTIITKG